ncbi:MAG: bifunctional hydroxymethylpyrimidine kinase/phosphomethylpyrimidine kinase [Nitrospirae bacterium]|nr:bifunctional hydroxymethylpyrimidine kinase/phosphomethylpyrimidine kinase [Nitrospirota bacterium]
MDAHRLRKIAKQFRGKTVMVLGDFVADEYILGKTSRISREAPVLILQYDSRQIVLGGAGNATNNLAALGATVIPIGMIGDDETGRDVTRHLKQLGINTSLLLVQRGRVTTTKTRIMAGGQHQHTSQQQVVRIDRGEFDSLPKGIEDIFLKSLDEKIDQVDALVVSDYQYGVLSPRVIEKVNQIAKRGRRIITVDSRYRMLSFHGVTAVTPNEPEVEEALGLRLDDREETVRSAGEQILKRVKSRAVLITRGSKGMALIESGRKAVFIPVFGTDEIADVTGAGDTVIVIFTLALACGATLKEAVHLANIGGGIVVMKRGTATVHPEELEAALGKSSA